MVAREGILPSGGVEHLNFRCGYPGRQILQMLDEVSAEEPGVVVEARGVTMPLSARGFGTQGSAEVVTDLHWAIQII